MKVKLNCGLVGNDFDHRPGDVIDVPADEAQRMIAADQAVAFTGGKPETASTAPSENMARAAAQPRQRRPFTPPSNAAQ